MFLSLSDILDRGNFLSLEFYIITLFFISFTLFSAIRKLTKTLENKRFIVFIGSVAISIILDAICYFCDEFGNADTRILNIISNSLYISLTMLISYYWLLFVGSKLEFKFAYSKKALWILRAYIIIHCLIVVTSNWTGFMFKIDENGIYQRGSLFFLQLIPWLFSFAGVVLSIIRICNKKYAANRNFYWSIIIFTAFPFICEGFQLFGAGSPSISIGYTLGTLFMYIILLEDNISADSLTGLNNRSSLMKYLYSKIRAVKSADEMYFFILDINDFKKINDIYGHIEGDHALIIFANCLKIIEKQYQAYIARYGGDEFVIIIDGINQNIAESISNELSALLNDAANSNQLKYQLTMSMGYTKCYSSDANNMDKMIARADGLMYLNKANYKEAMHNKEKTEK